MLCKCGQPGEWPDGYVNGVEQFLCQDCHEKEVDADFWAIMTGEQEQAAPVLASSEYVRGRWRAVIKQGEKVLMQGNTRKTQDQADQDVLILLRAYEINERLHSRF